MKAPAVEKQYSALQRDYTTAQTEYRETKAKLMAAEMSQNLEQGRKGQRFTLVQPPILPEEPVSPNRIAIIFVGLILSAGVGVGVVVLAEAMDESIRGAKQLADVTGASPMISIPYIYLEEELAKTNRQSLLRHSCSGSDRAFCVIDDTLFLQAAGCYLVSCYA